MAAPFFIDKLPPETVFRPTMHSLRFTSTAQASVRASTAWFARNLGCIVAWPLPLPLVACLLLAFSVKAAGPDPLESYRAAQEAGEFQSAAEQLKQLYRDTPQDLSLEFARLARSGDGHFDKNQLSQLYRLAAESLQHTAANHENASQRFLIRLIAATQLAKDDRQHAASEILIRALDETATLHSPTRTSRESAAVDQSLQLAHAFLTTDQPADALLLYGGLTRYFESLDQENTLDAAQNDQYALALMGLGWATAGAASHQQESTHGDANQPNLNDQTPRFRIAARRLMRFVDRFPQHPDAAGSAAMRVYCLSKCLDLTSRVTQATAEEQLSVAIDEYLQRWPEHPTAVSVVQIALGQTGDKTSKQPQDGDQLAHSQSQADAPTVRGSIQNWISRPGATQSWPIRFVGQVLLVAGNSLPPESFDHAIARIATEDQSGQITADLLAQITDSGKLGLAEKVAADVIGRSETDNAARSIDAACRWAARRGHWTMLSSQAMKTTIISDGSQASEGTDLAPYSRLFAESLTRTGETKQAYRWWSRIVDQSEKVDFTTLLRCAESAVAAAPIGEARVRLEQLRRSIESASNENSGSESASSKNAGLESPHPKSFWCDLLEGDLAIRSVQFDRARALYQAVIRAATAPAAVQGRAQWMIGETYFMQKKYSDAINAYRKVDGIDTNASYVAASLVQAGKSFEQLGRTREAGICYGTLIRRFANSSYATEAKRRMAALPALDNPSTPLKR